jgi:hypothetical protein
MKRVLIAGHHLQQLEKMTENWLIKRVAVQGKFVSIPLMHSYHHSCPSINAIPFHSCILFIQL